MPKKKKSIEKEIMNEIKKDEIKMKPKIYFVLGSALLGFGFAFATVAGIFFTNVSLFRLRAHKPFDYLMLKGTGLRPFLVTFPWVPLIIAISIIAIGIIFLKKYDLSYKSNFLSIIIGLLSFILLTAIILDRVGINDRVKGIRHMQSIYGEKRHEQIMRQMHERKLNPPLYYMQKGGGGR